MSMFQNPHAQYNQMLAQQQFGNQQPLYLGNNMYQLPNGQIVQMQPNGQFMPVNMPQAQQPMNPYMQQQLMQQQLARQQMQQGFNPYMQQQAMGYQVNTNRFTDASLNVSANTTSSAMNYREGDSSMLNRFDVRPSNPIQEQVNVAINRTEFMVTPQKGVTFEHNDNFKIITYIENISDNQIFVPDRLLLVDCFAEAVEGVIEIVNKESTKLVTMINFIIANNFYKVTKQDELKKQLELDIRKIYKQLKSLYKSLTDKHDINMFNMFDTILTNKINDYLAVNAKNEISIDCFMTDFNELLKIIRNTEDELEDDFLEYMNKFIKELKVNSDLTSNETVINESGVLVYMDKFLIELGLNTLIPGVWMKVKKDPANVLLTSLSFHVSNELSGTEFYLVTLDKEIVFFKQSEENELWLKKVS